jgi:hypothetical protein
MCVTLEETLQNGCSNINKNCERQPVAITLNFSTLKWSQLLLPCTVFLTREKKIPRKLLLIFGFFGFSIEFGLAKEFDDQSRKGVFLYFHVFLGGNEFLEPKKRKSH